MKRALEEMLDRSSGMASAYELGEGLIGVDQRDFSVFRLKGGKRFQLTGWF